MNDQVKVTLDPQTPTQQAVAKASQTFNVADSLGRVITLKNPGVLAQFHLIRALGEDAENRVYVRMVMPLIYVSAIDGEMVLPITKKSEIDAVIKRLDEHGIAATLEGMEKHFGLSDPEADQAAIKK